MANEQFYMGKDGFAWFVGVVEDRDDPDQQGRVRVRCLGHHTDNVIELPTTDLPWAHVMHSVTDPSMHGMGNSSSWLVEGSWVMGFFRDAIEKQYPLIMGSLPGNPIAPADWRSGFNDPRHKENDLQPYYNVDGKNPEEYGEYGPYPLGAIKDTTLPKEKQTKFSRPSGHTYGETDTSRLARGVTSETHGALEKRRKTRRTSIPTATRPHIPSVEDASVLGTGRPDPVVLWNEPHPKGLTKDADPYVSAKYPLNHVFESEAGHIMEVDDTPGGERLLREHSSGTFEEIHPTGDKVVKVIGSNYEIIAGSSNVLIKGDVNLTIEGTKKELIKGNYILEVEGDYTRKIHKNERVKVGAGKSGGNLESEIRGNYSYNINDEVKGRVGKDQTVTVLGNEIRAVEGFYKHTVTDDITQKTTSGSMIRSAFLDIVEEAGFDFSVKSLEVDIRSAWSTTIKAGIDITEIAGNKIIETAGTTIDSTAGTIYTIVGTTKVDINP